MSRYWKLMSLHDVVVDEALLRAILERLADMAAIPEGYDLDSIIDTFDDGKKVVRLDSPRGLAFLEGQAKKR